MASDWDQIVTDHYMCQLSFQGPTGLPEDRFITTYMMRNDNVFDRNGMLDAVEAALVGFWADAESGPANSIMAYLPATLGNPRLKIFDMGQPPPRIPEERLVLGIDPAGTGTPLPFEVAACVSYHTGGPGPRNRGRIYVGPLNQLTVTQDTDVGDVRLNPTFRALLVERATWLASDPGLECTWVLWSRANAETHQIVGGWVDNAFDTQRRRGVAPSVRTNWGAPIVSGGGGAPGGDPLA